MRSIGRDGDVWNVACTEALRQEVAAGGAVSVGVEHERLLFAPNAFFVDDNCASRNFFHEIAMQDPQSFR